MNKKPIKTKKPTTKVMYAIFCCGDPAWNDGTLYLLWPTEASAQAALDEHNAERMADGRAGLLSRADALPDESERIEGVIVDRKKGTMTDSGGHVYPLKCS